jgi:hypothetical protein
MVFTTQQALDITTANAKVSADGTINTHSDVNALTPQTGDVLAWNGTVWTSMTIGDSITEQQALDIIAANAKVSADGPINTHSDVHTENNLTGQVLMWDGTNWVNTTKTFITEQQALDITANNAKVSADLSINTHSDVTIYLPAKNDILQWSGTQWVNSPFKAFGTGALTNTNTPACAAMQIAPLTPLYGSHGPGSLNDASRVEANNWNGTPFNPCGLTNEQLYNTIVKGNWVLGLEAEYNKLPPYQNHLLPTEEEQLNWMIRCINHIRKLYGNPNPVKVSQRLTNEALWRIEKAWCPNFAPNNITDWYFIPTNGQQNDYPSTLNEWPNRQSKKGVNNYQWRYELGGWAISQDQPYWWHIRSLLWSILVHQQNKSLFSGFYGMDEIGIAMCTVPPGFDFAGALAYSFSFAGTQRSYC